MKGSIRVLGVDDGFFKPKKKGKAALVGVVFRLDGRIEGIVKREINVDGLDCTSKIIQMCSGKFKDQIQCILLDGINFAGFNIVDVERLFKKTNKPIINVFRKMPRMKLIEKALSGFKDSSKRMKLIEKAGPIHAFKRIFFQCHGIEPGEAKKLLKKTIFYSNLPEPVRIAHLVASGVTIGESTHP